MRLPIVKQLFSNNDNTIRQTDIVMLLTPRIMRTHELTRAGPEPDLHRHAEQHVADRSAGDDWRSRGTGSAPPPPARRRAAGRSARRRADGRASDAAARPAGDAAACRAGVADRQHAAAGGSAGQLADSGHGAARRRRRRCRRRAVHRVRTAARAAPAPRRHPRRAAAAPPPAPAQPPPAAPARITLSPPSEMRVGSGPYTVPISIAGATRLSTLTLSITYNPALVRVRNVQEGTFMRQGGITPAFSSQIDDKSGRIDIVITRPGDKTGASTSGLLAALLVEPLAAGTGSLGLSGSATRAGRRRGGAAVPAGGNHGALGRPWHSSRSCNAASRSSSCWSSRRSC